MPDAIIQPLRTERSPVPGETVVMVSSGSDFDPVCEGFGGLDRRERRLLMSTLTTVRSGGHRVSVIGPVMGAPYAVLLLENMLAWGARRVVYFGWCGSIDPDVVVGDCIVVTGAYADEGTSRHYGHPQDTIIEPTGRLTQRLTDFLGPRIRRCVTGQLWTTDAVFRETPERIRTFQQMGMLGVEMEISALFAVARFRRADVAAVVVVSDELHRMTWEPGFSQPAFKENRARVASLLAAFCQQEALDDPM